MTDDLPTPPLPEAISSTRVRLDGSAKGIARPSAWPWACWLPAVDGRVAVQLLAELGALVVGHHREVELGPLDAGEGGDRRGDPVLDLVAQRAARDGEGDADRHVTAVDGDAPDHAEVDDAAVQLGIFDGAQRVDDVGFGGHGTAPG